jgi:hypothetical protein
VNALDSTRERHGDCVAATTRFSGGQEQSRAHSFSAGENGIAHRFVNRRGLGLFAGQKLVERAIDGFGARGEELIQIELF